MSRFDHEFDRMIEKSADWHVISRLSLSRMGDAIDHLWTELKDARLALAMVRGEGWPEGWEWQRGWGWVSPDRRAFICNEIRPNGTMNGWRLMLRGPYERGIQWIADRPEPYPDPLAALRAWATRAKEVAP